MSYQKGGTLSYRAEHKPLFLWSEKFLENRLLGLGQKEQGWGPT